MAVRPWAYKQQGQTDMKRYLLAAASVAAFAAAPAAARDHSAYFGLEVGPMWAQDSHVRFPTVTDGSADFDIDHKLGVDGDLIAGYDFGIIRAEVEGAHKWAKHNKYTFTSNGASFDADGHSRAYSLMGNILFDLGDNEKVNFYGGGGVGIAWVRQTDGSGLVVSKRAVFDGNLHFTSVIIDVTRGDSIVSSRVR